MSPFPKLMSVLAVLTMAVSACEIAPPVTSQPEVVDEMGETAADGPVADAPIQEAETVESGCGLEGFPGDSEFATLLCDYQAVLVRALSSGVVVDPNLMNQVSDAIAAHVADPTAARDAVADVIAAIEQQIVSAVPQPASPTIADLTDGAFDCMARAGELLQEAFQRESIGGVVIPELDQWELAFDEAALLAESGDLISATSLVCDLNVDMEAVLFQS